MKTLLLLLLASVLSVNATTITFRYGMNPDAEPVEEDPFYPDHVGTPNVGLTVAQLVFSNYEDNPYLVVTNPPNDFSWVVPDGQAGYVTVYYVGRTNSSGGLVGTHQQPYPSAGKWVMWSVPSALSQEKLTAADRTDVAARAGLGFACIGLGALFFRCYKTGRSGT